MNETILVSEKNTSVLLLENTSTHLQDCRINSLNVVGCLKNKILSGEKIKSKEWDVCVQALDSAEEILKTASGIYQRTLPINRLWDVTYLHDEVLFNLQSQYAFFVQLFESDNHAMWYFCTQSHYVVEVNQSAHCMRSYELKMIGSMVEDKKNWPSIPECVHIEDRKMLSSVAILNGIEKAIQAGFTTQRRLTMRDHVSKN